MNEPINTILRRKSVRKFKPEPVAPEDLYQILQCARWAPSGSNQQPWQFWVKQNPFDIASIADLISDNFDSFLHSIQQESIKSQLDSYKKYLEVIRTAPLVIFVLGKPYQSYLSKILEQNGVTAQQHVMIDVHPASLSIGAAIENMLVAAESLGYGSCWMTGPLIFQKELEDFLGVEHPYHLVSMVSFGKPFDSAFPTRYRLPFDETCVYRD